MKYAYVTILNNNDYYKGVIALFESIKKTKTTIENFVVLVNENIFGYILNDFYNRGYIVKKNPSFDLKEYDKIVILYPDMFIVKNIDKIFNYSPMSSFKNTKLIVNPKFDNDNCDRIIPIPENYILNDFFIEQYLNNNSNLEEVYIIRFTEKYKPWMLNKKGREDYLKKCEEENKTNLAKYFKKYVDIIDTIGKKISIITPFYNTLDYTKNLAQVLEKQLTNEVEWIIVDDGTNEYELDKINARIVHLEHNSGNASKPRNVGLDIACGDFIVFVDSDDLVYDNYIDTIINKIDNDYFDYCYFGWEMNQEKYIIKNEPLKWNRSVWNCIYKREIIGNERFNSNYNVDEDGDFNDRVKKGKRSNILSVLYKYNFMTRDDSITSLCSKGVIKINK